MYIHNEGTEQEISIRLCMESSDNGREYFDDYDTLEEMSEEASEITAKAMVKSAEDGVERMIGFVIIHKSRYGKDGHGKDIEIFGRE